MNSKAVRWPDKRWRWVTLAPDWKLSVDAEGGMTVVGERTLTVPEAVHAGVVTVHEPPIEGDGVEMVENSYMWATLIARQPNTLFDYADPDYVRENRWLRRELGLDPWDPT